MFKDKCFYCEEVLTKDNTETAWYDNKDEIDCEMHPASFDPVMLKETGIKAPHLTEFEVALIVAQDYHRKTQQVPKRAVDSNVVYLSSKARETSKKAATKVLPKTGSLRKTVYDFINNRKEFGATDQEMEVILRVSGNSIRPTRLTLADDGWIMDSKQTRVNEHGNECVVWVTANIFAETDGKLFI